MVWISFWLGDSDIPYQASHGYSFGVASIALSHQRQSANPYETALKQHTSPGSGMVFNDGIRRRSRSGGRSEKNENGIVPRYDHTI